MKRNAKILMIALLAVTMLIGLAGCRIGSPDLDEVLDEYGVSSQVTYYANGGMFSDSQGATKSIYVRAGDRAPEFGAVSVSQSMSLITVERKGYLFGRWVWAETDENGDPVFSEGSEVPNITDIPVDFSEVLEENERWYVVAMWNVDVKLDFILKSDIPVTHKVNGEDVTNKDGDVIGTSSAGTDGTIASRDIERVIPNITSDVTFVEYYADEECTIPFEWPFRIPDGATENARVYAKFIEGKWNIVKDSAGVSRMFNGMFAVEANKYYIISDITYEGTYISLVNTRNMTATIEGNGHTISGLKVRNNSNAGRGNYSLLGNIGDSAVIRNVSFEDVTINISLPPDADLGIFAIAYDISKSAKTEGLKVSGKMTIVYPFGADAIIDNLQRGDDGEFISKAHFLICSYGGEVLDDAAIMEAAGIEGAFEVDIAEELTM